MSKIKIIIALLILLFLLVIFIPGYSKLQKLRGVNQGLTEQLEKLKITNIKLAREIKKLKGDLLYVEEVARKKMGLTKKGEVIYKIIDDEKAE